MNGVLALCWKCHQTTGVTCPVELYVYQCIKFQYRHWLSCVQAMVGRTQEMAANQWPICGVRDVYSDFNDLTLDITIEALFGGMRRGSGSGAGAGGPPEDSGALLAEVGPAISTAFTFFSRRATTMFASGCRPSLPCCDALHSKLVYFNMP